jgi:transcriptional regulator with XRE-family HTH domain
MSLIQTVSPVDIFCEITYFISVMAVPRKHISLIKNRRGLYEIVGRRVREARKASKLTQEELASRVSMTRTSVTNIEKGRQKLLLHTLFELAAAMKVQIVQLVPEPVENQPHIEQQLTNGLSKAEKEWIVGELSKPSKNKQL